MRSLKVAVDQIMRQVNGLPVKKKRELLVTSIEKLPRAEADRAYKEATPLHRQIELLVPSIRQLTLYLCIRYP